ncbi:MULTISPECIES: hypothetical protein [Flavobacteriaceae]|uniref:Adhesin domain-containing protein n=2 Tax=Flavobacteriaceae TaxID=49546 RepID=A0A4Y8AWC7_9FLAO|nr:MULTISPECIES: hypothetical protein [Flavobacteriaceae]TEW76846.1 hypothetical protein E2488_03080 [Gramella jeungdoensis]GGK49526.1 hypothetical protein GCM10007963_17360 [Lutibacter litoralis]
MKTYLYKLTTFLLLFTVVINAQTFDKKIKENFKVNSDVEIVINASYTDVEIETWNRNEVSIEAVMEVSGVKNSEADKLLKEWKFEALGNKNTVKINSASGNLDFSFNFDFPEFEISNVEIPEFDFNFPEIELPEMPEFPEMEFDYEAYKMDSTYLKKYKMQIAEHVDKFKNSDWKKQLDSMRNSSEFKKAMEELKKASKEMAKEVKAFQNSEEFKQTMLEAKKLLEQARLETLENRDEILEQVKLTKEVTKVAIEELKRMKDEGKLDSLKNYSETTYFNLNRAHNSKVKIKKHLKIKVPKKATFNLNVRHGKVTIPESNKKMSANMSYGNFVGGIINGENNELMFANSPVSINSLISSNITLKNVPNSVFGTFENVNLFSNSSNVVIHKISNNVTLNQKFGNIIVNDIDLDFKILNLNFEYTKATIPLEKIEANYTLDTSKSNINTVSENSDFLKNEFMKILKKHETSIEGSFKSTKKTENTIKLKSNFSTVTII